MEVYLLNLYPGSVTVTVTDNTNGNSLTYTLSQYQYVDISSMISSPNDRLTVQVPGVGTGNIQLFPSNAQTIYITQNNIYSNSLPAVATLKEILYDNILQDMNLELAKVYEALLSLISAYASGKSLSPATLSNVSSTLQQINNMLQNAIQFEKETSTSFEGVSAYQQVYNNLNQIYESLTNDTLTVGELQSLQLPSYSTPEAGTIASIYTRFLNNAINTMESASSHSNSSTSSSSSTSSRPRSSTSSPSSTSSQSNGETWTCWWKGQQIPCSEVAQYQGAETSGPLPPGSYGWISTHTSNVIPTPPPSSGGTTVSPSSPTTSPTSSSTTSPTSSTSPTTISQGQVLAQIQAGDISSLRSEISEIPPEMLPVVSAVTQLYQEYDIPDGTPLSTVVGRLLSDIRDAYYKISNHKQEQLNTQKLSMILKLYNTLARSGLVPASQSASKLSNLVQTSGIIPAVPSVLGQSYPGKIYSNLV